MTSLSHTTGYAIEALACLARQGRDPMLVREIAGMTSMPSPYLSKIFQRLGDAGIVETKRGYKGGVRLTRPPDDITLLQIDTAVESTRHPVQAPPPRDAPRPRTFREAFHKAYRDHLATVTLAEVLAYETRTPT